MRTLISHSRLRLLIVFMAMGFAPPMAARAADSDEPMLKAHLVIHTEKESVVGYYDGTRELAGTRFWMIRVGDQHWLVNPAHIIAIQVLDDAPTTQKTGG